MSINDEPVGAGDTPEDQIYRSVERGLEGGQRRFTEANLQAAFRQGWLAADENHPAVEALARVRGLHRKFGLAV